MSPDRCLRAHFVPVRDSGAMTPELAQQIALQEQFFAPLIIQPEGVILTRDELGGVPVEWTEPTTGVTRPDLVVAYFHGGGYSSGLAAWARPAAARLALGLGCRVVAADYRLTPQFPYPAAHEDALAVYRHLIGPGGFAPGKVAVAGDSAGGAISLSLMADARDLGLPQPACGMLNSVWAVRLWMKQRKLAKNRHDALMDRSMVEAANAMRFFELEWLDLGDALADELANAPEVAEIGRAHV